MDVLGLEPEDEARPRTTLHVGWDLHPTTKQMASSHVPSPLSIPYREDNHGLSRIIMVNQNRCSIALSRACHVVLKL